MSIREIYQGLQEQGSSEVITYTLTTTNWGSDPINPVATVYLLKLDGSNEAIDEDVTATVMPSGSATVSGDVITWKPLQLLTKGRKYRLEMYFEFAGGNSMEAYAIIEGTR